MKLQKYLAFLSYNGKSFSGSQIQLVKNKQIPTVQESLKVYLKLLGSHTDTFRKLHNKLFNSSSISHRCKS